MVVRFLDDNTNDIFRIVGFFVARDKMFINKDLMFSKCSLMRSCRCLIVLPM